MHYAHKLVTGVITNQASDLRNWHRFSVDEQAVAHQLSAKTAVTADSTAMMEWEGP